VLPRIEKGPRVFVLGPFKHVPGRTVLDEGAVVHDRDSLADLANDLEVVRYQDQRELVLLSQFGDQIEDLCLYRHVEGGDRLVEDQQSWPGRKSSGNGDSLAFATRKCSRVLLRGGRRQTDLIEKFGNAFSTIGWAADGVGDKRLLDDGANPKARIEGQTRILEYCLEPLSQGAHPGLR
jgi:hypothetical protein